MEWEDEECPSPSGVGGEWLLPKSQPHSTFRYFICLHTVTGEGIGTPLQYSCLENPMDGGTW